VLFRSEAFFAARVAPGPWGDAPGLALRQAMIGRFLVMLIQHPDATLKSLASRIDFNETYRR
jgi:hypothetical protein